MKNKNILLSVVIGTHLVFAMCATCLLLTGCQSLESGPSNVDVAEAFVLDRGGKVVAQNPDGSFTIAAIEETGDRETDKLVVVDRIPDSLSPGDYMVLTCYSSGQHNSYSRAHFHHCRKGWRIYYDRTTSV